MCAVIPNILNQTFETVRIDIETYSEDTICVLIADNGNVGFQRQVSDDEIVF